MSFVSAETTGTHSVTTQQSDVIAVKCTLLLEMPSPTRLPETESGSLSWHSVSLQMMMMASIIIAIIVVLLLLLVCGCFPCMLVYVPHAGVHRGEKRIWSSRRW